MKIIKILFFLIIVSIFTSIFLLTSCEEQETTNNTVLDTVNTKIQLETNTQKEIKIVLFEAKWYPSYIEIEKGDKVQLRIRNANMDDTRFKIKDLGINELVPKGQEVKLEFTSNKQGRFQITQGTEKVRGSATLG